MTENKLTLLYVEDDLDILHDIVFLLKNYFSEIFTATDGEDAFEKFKTHNPSIILLDINIPKINGIELAKMIRENDKKTPILFLTAYSDSNKLIEAINLGVSSYIIKPFNIDELKDAISKIISNKQPSSKIPLSLGFEWDRTVNKILHNFLELKLTNKESLLLEMFYSNRQKFFTPCEIAAEIFPKNAKDSKCNNSVQLISRFKKKVLKDFGVEEFFILNVYGLGYKLM